MSGFDNDVVYGSNVDFSGNSNVSAQITLDGQLLIGSAAVPNIRVGTLTAGPGITITNGAGTISIGVTSGGVVLETLTGNTGGTVSPTANNINTLGTGSITIAGSGSTLTTQLTGLTNHAVLVGAGTATITKVGPTATAGQILQSAGASADPAFSTAAYPVTAGTTGNVITSDGTNFVSSTPTGGGFIWSEITGTSQSAAVGHGYVANNAGLVTITLPASFALGDVIRIAGLGTGLWSLVANTGNIINFGSFPTSAGGSLTATNRYDAIEVVGLITNTTWGVISSIGNLTIA